MAALQDASFLAIEDIENDHDSETTSPSDREGAPDNIDAAEIPGASGVQNVALPMPLAQG